MNPRADLLEAVCVRDAAQTALDDAARDVSRKLYAWHVAGATRAEIAATLGVSYERVRQLLKRAEDELRAEYEADEQEERHARAVVREAEARRNYGMRSGACNCGQCGRWKARPSARCDFCGDEPLTHNGDPLELDRAHGYA